MSVTIGSSWLKRLGIAGIAAASLCAATFVSAPAEARVFVAIGAPGWGYYGPPAPYYYGYYPYRPYAYAYPAPGIVFGWHHHRHHHHW